MKKIIKTFFHPDACNQYIVSEILTEDGIISKIIPIEDVLDNLITIPIRPLTDKMLLSKAEEMLLK